MACIKALDGQLSDDEMTLGIAHANQHLAPTPLDATIVVRATLAEVQDRRLRFDVWATDGVDTILQGSHERGLVKRARFLSKVEAKREAMMYHAQEH
jgi:fluoroacetyl-CoA thioesterase